MRVFLAVTLALLLHASAQAAPGGEPHVKRNTPYPEARRQLIAQGFEPVTILKWDVDTGRCEDAAFTDICRHYREVSTCAGAGGGRSPCEFIYRNRKDGRYWSVGTDGLPLALGGSMRQIRFDYAQPAEPDHLYDLTVRLKNGRPLTFKRPKD